MSNFNFNKVILGGRLTDDAELKTTPAGVLVTSFSIAVNRRGSKNNETDFIECSAWNKTAELITKYFQKGSSICIVGSLQRRSWTDRRGNKHYVTNVVVDEVYFVDSKRDGTLPDTLIDNEQIEQAAARAVANFDDSEFENMTSNQDLPF
ncbi:MAG: single-stranded DNA-binding protein [Ruminococcaceae bacterium]|nr:single-stranded DNA-binding protein [Oscillospiraceae bacterium]